MMYANIAGCNMVEAIIDTVENLSVEVEVEAETGVAECQMVDITKDAEHIEDAAPEPQFDEKSKVAYPTVEEELIDFFNCVLGALICNGMRTLFSLFYSFTYYL